METGTSDAPARSVTLEEAHFALLIVVPHTVDELHLGGKQRRIIYTAAAPEEEGVADESKFDDGSALRWPTEWSQVSVNP